MYTQFTKETRIELGALKRRGLSNIECASELGMNKSTIGREVKRYTDEDGVYRGSRAHKKYLAKRKESKKKYQKIKNDPKLKRRIKMRLKKKDSPEQIAGRIKLDDKLPGVCHEVIYQWIFNEEPELKKYLRYISKKGKYRRKRGTKAREKVRDEAKIKRIDERPEAVETREWIGDFEGDTIVGKDRKRRLLSNVDRKSGYGILDKIDIVRAENIRDKIKERFSKLPKYKKHTYTYDNGKELGEEDRDLEEKIGIQVYRAYPYHSWERGSNENYNGLVREFFPKGTDFATISATEVKRVERNLNHRPRKRLGYLTPYEVFVLGKEPVAVQARM